MSPAVVAPVGTRIPPPPAGVVHVARSPRPMARRPATGHRKTRVRIGLGHHLLETRFADTRFATEQHYLPEAVLDLRPALPQQPDFLLPAHQRSQPGAAGGFQATAGHALIEDAIDRQRLGEAFQDWG